MTEQEKLDWQDLFNYVKKEIMGYDDTIKFPKYLMLRLKGYATGKLIANSKQKNQASYSYKEILIVFKMLKGKIVSYIGDGAKFKDEQHKINAIMYIIEKEGNDIILKYRNAKKHSEKIDSIEVNVVESEYVPRERKKVQDRLKNLF